MSIATNILDCAARPAPNTGGKTTTSYQNAVGVCSKTPRVYTDINTYGRGRTERPPNRAAWVTQPRRRRRGRPAWRMRGAGRARKKQLPLACAPPKNNVSTISSLLYDTYWAYGYGNAAPRARASNTYNPTVTPLCTGPMSTAKRHPQRAPPLCDAAVSPVGRRVWRVGGYGIYY